MGVKRVLVVGLHVTTFLAPLYRRSLMTSGIALICKLMASWNLEGAFFKTPLLTVTCCCRVFGSGCCRGAVAVASRASLASAEFIPLLTKASVAAYCTLHPKSGKVPHTSLNALTTAASDSLSLALRVAS